MTDRSFSFERRGVLNAGAAGLVTLGTFSIPDISSAKAPSMTQDWDKTFPRSKAVDHQKVSFRNRYGTSPGSAGRASSRQSWSAGLSVP